MHTGAWRAHRVHCLCVQVDVKNAVYRDDSVHELNPPQIRGVVPRLARRISSQKVPTALLNAVL